MITEDIRRHNTELGLPKYFGFSTFNAAYKGSRLRLWKEEYKGTWQKPSTIWHMTIKWIKIHHYITRNMNIHINRQILISYYRFRIHQMLFHFIFRKQRRSFTRQVAPNTAITILAKTGTTLSQILICSVPHSTRWSRYVISQKMCNRNATLIIVDKSKGQTYEKLT